MQRIVFLVAFTLLLTPLSFAQEDSTHVVLKNGGEMNVLITKIDPWGCTLSDNRTLLFTIVSELSTKDTILVQQVMAKVDSIKIRKKGDVKILDFAGAKFQKIPTEGGFVIVRAASLAISVDYSFMYSFQVNVSPRKYGFLVFSAGFLSGTTTSLSNRTYGVFAGAGYIWNFDNESFLLTINYGSRVITPEFIPSQVKNFGFINSEVHLFGSMNSKFTFSVGGYLFLSKQGWGGNETWGGLKLGLGMRFF